MTQSPSFIEGLIKTIHNNTETNDLHEINSPQCRDAIQKYIENSGLVLVPRNKDHDGDLKNWLVIVTMILQSLVQCTAVEVYIPFSGNCPNGCFSDEKQILRPAAPLDSTKIIEKYEPFLKRTAVGFLGEDGCEYFVFVGTKTSPINTVVIQLYGNKLTTAENFRPKLRKFIYWLSKQGFHRHREGD